MAIREFFNALIEYETPRYVKVHNPLVGLVLRSSQALIISYIVGWAIIHERGYQESSPVESSFITKVKGTTSSGTEGDNPLYNRYKGVTQVLRTWFSGSVYEEIKAKRKLGSHQNLENQETTTR